MKPIDGVRSVVIEAPSLGGPAVRIPWSHSDCPLTFTSPIQLRNTAADSGDSILITFTGHFDRSVTLSSC